MFPICVSKALPSPSERTTDGRTTPHRLRLLLPLLQSPNGEQGRSSPFASRVMEFRARLTSASASHAQRTDGRTAAPKGSCHHRNDGRRCPQRCPRRTDPRCAQFPRRTHATSVRNNRAEPAAADALFLSLSPSFPLARDPSSDLFIRWIDWTEGRTDGRTCLLRRLLTRSLSLFPSISAPRQMAPAFTPER